MIKIISKTQKFSKTIKKHGMKLFKFLNNKFVRCGSYWLYKLAYTHKTIQLLTFWVIDMSHGFKNSRNYWTQKRQIRHGRRSRGMQIIPMHLTMKKLEIRSTNLKGLELTYFLDVLPKLVGPGPGGLLTREYAWSFWPKLGLWDVRSLIWNLQ